MKESIFVCEEGYAIDINENEILLNDIRYCLEQGDEGELKPHLDAIRSILFRK